MHRPSSSNPPTTLPITMPAIWPCDRPLPPPLLLVAGAGEAAPLDEEEERVLTGLAPPVEVPAAVEVEVTKRFEPVDEEAVRPDGPLPGTYETGSVNELDRSRVDCSLAGVNSVSVGMLNMVPMSLVIEPVSYGWLLILPPAWSGEMTMVGTRPPGPYESPVY